MEHIITVNNLDEMQGLARKVATHLFPGFVLCLSGDLGAGKTTFTQFLGKTIGIKDTINSPTFTIMKNYDEGLYPLTHIDAYRLEGIGADYELEEYIHGFGVSVIEWYEHIIESLPQTYLSMHIEFLDEHRRRLTIKGSGRYEGIAQAISH